MLRENATHQSILSVDCIQEESDLIEFWWHRSRPRILSCGIKTSYLCVSVLQTLIEGGKSSVQVSSHILNNICGSSTDKFNERHKKIGLVWSQTDNFMETSADCASHLIIWVTTETLQDGHELLVKRFFWIELYKAREVVGTHSTTAQKQHGFLVCT